MDKTLMMKRVKIRMMRTSPFLSSILFSTKVDWCEKDSRIGEIPTACTDGERILVNPKYIEGLAATDKEREDWLASILAHETWHIAKLDPFRIQKRDPKIFNIASDATINENLGEDGYKLHPEWVNKEQVAKWTKGWDCTGRATEAIYEELMKHTTKITIIGKGPGEVAPHPSLTGDKSENGKKESPGDAEARHKIQTQKAIDIAKAMGNLPASIARTIAKVLESEVNWREELWAAVTTIMGNDDYSWKRCNRRYIWQNHYLPSMTGVKCGEVALFVDTSGSIGEKELEAALGELNAIFEAVHPEKMYLGFCDADMPDNAFSELDESDLPMEPQQFSEKCVGGGGTSFIPPFKYLEKKGIRPMFAIYITDMYGSFPDTPPDYPVIWVSFTADIEAPFGKTIYVKT